MYTLVLTVSVCLKIDIVNATLSEKIRRIDKVFSAQDVQVSTSLSS